MENVEKQNNPKDESVKKMILDENVLVKMGDYSFYADHETAREIKKAILYYKDFLNEK
jgi:molybdopterin/thiamine biosynthesis adenylyltransferase